MTPFRKLHHVCLVVHDLERTVAFYEGIGIGPWEDYPKGQPYVDLQVPDPAASIELKYRVVQLENFQLQLCQPSALDSPQRRFLDEHGEGVYHLGFEVDDLLEGEATARQFGLGVLAKGARADGTGFCYFDTRVQAGTVLEIRKTSAAAVPSL